jgi:hypothetical protein
LINYKETINYRESMSEDSERMKRLVSFKKKLEDRAQELDSELKEVQTMLETVNSLLLEKGFKHIEIPKGTAKTGVTAREEQASAPIEPEPVPERTPPESVTELKTAEGEPLAELFLNEAEESLRVIPARDKNFNTGTPPFTQFLVERVMQKMQERDNELVRAGQIAPEKIFNYKIIQQDGTIHEIEIRNIDQDRLRELKSSIRWTLEKMYEKTKTQT